MWKYITKFCFDNLSHHLPPSSSFEFCYFIIAMDIWCFFLVYRLLLSFLFWHMGRFLFWHLMFFFVFILFTTVKNFCQYLFFEKGETPLPNLSVFVFRRLYWWSPLYYNFVFWLSCNKRQFALNVLFVFYINSSGNLARSQDCIKRIVCLYVTSFVRWYTPFLCIFRIRSLEYVLLSDNAILH